jgi:serine/threonine protein kinase
MPRRSRALRNRWYDSSGSHELVLNVSQMSALNHVHLKGLVHRDIKPGNILASLQDPGHFFLIDYGLAQPSQSGKVVLPSHLESTKEFTLSGSLEFTSIDNHDGLRKSTARACLACADPDGCL